MLVNSYILDTTLANSVLDEMIRQENNFNFSSQRMRFVFLKATFSATLETIGALFRVAILGAVALFTAFQLELIHIYLKNADRRVSTSFRCMYTFAYGVVSPHLAKARAIGLLKDAGDEMTREAMIRAHVRFDSTIDLALAREVLQESTFRARDGGFLVGYFTNYVRKVTGKQAEQVEALTQHQTTVDALTASQAEVGDLKEEKIRDQIQIGAQEEKIKTLQSEVKSLNAEMENMRKRGIEREGELENRMNLLRLEVEALKGEIELYEFKEKQKSPPQVPEVPAEQEV